MNKPILNIVIPCYNEEEVLPITSKLFLDKIYLIITFGFRIYSEPIGNNYYALFPVIIDKNSNDY